MDILRLQPWYNFTGSVLQSAEQVHQELSLDGLFYVILGVLFYFALIKLLFAKYLGNLLTLFFRVSMRQQQIRDQVVQSPLPSLLLNILFVVSGGLYAGFLIRNGHFADKADFWVLAINCCILLALIYLVKFFLLKCTGWVFNIQRATDTYIFVVFMTNKIIGISLLPFLVILSFSNALVSEVAITVSLIMVGIFFIRRFSVSVAPIRKEIKVNGLHFFLYLCAFEIAPLLLIYKVLLTYLEKAY